MEGSNKKKTVYLTTLENLFQELKQARSVSSGGRKLILLGLLYDVHRVHQFFMQIENNLSESIEIPNLLLYDADVDYNQWSVDFDIKFDVNPFYMPDEEEEDAGESSVKQTLWHIFDTLSRDELKEIVCDRTNNVQLLSGILTNDITADQLALLLNESIVVLRESLVHIHTCISRHKMTNDEGEQLYRHEKEIFRMKYENAVVEKFEEWKDTFDDDEDVLKRNLNGKYCTEMLTLFISGFLAPRISAQVETDTTSLEEEFTKLNFFNIPNTMDAKAHYSALRELFNYNNKVVVPKTAQIGKYFFKHRKNVDAKQRMALFEFIKMIELIEEEKKPKREKTEALNYEGIKIAMTRTYFPKCSTALADKYNADWLGIYMDELMKSPHKEQLAKDWSVQSKKMTIVCCIIGVLKEVGVFKGKYQQLADLLKGKNSRTLSNYIGKGKKHAILDWTKEYVERQ